MFKCITMQLKNMSKIFYDLSMEQQVALHYVGICVGGSEKLLVMHGPVWSRQARLRSKFQS